RVFFDRIEVFAMSPARPVSTSTSAAPSAGDVAEQAQRVKDRLVTVLDDLPSPGEVTERDCTRLAGALRGLAKVFDRHASTCPAPPRIEPATGSAGRAWVYPGQQR
ncbi:hypothetical protein, partial [Saccharopolyspora sp. NPDC002578]